MSKRDDDNDNGGGYTLGDLLGGMLIGATAAAVGVAAVTLRSPRGRTPEPAPAPPAPPFEVEDREEHAAGGAAVDVSREGAGIN